MEKRTHRARHAAQTPSRATDILCGPVRVTYNARRVMPTVSLEVMTRAFMKRPSRQYPARNPVAIALYVNAAVLVAIGAVLLARDSAPSMLPTAIAQAQPAGIAGGAGIYLMPAQFSQSVWGCYILDVERQTLCAYTTSGSPPQLRLVASRRFTYDRELKNYNTNPPPQEIQDLIAKEAAGGRVTDRPPTVSPEAPK
jgi:hypothetical protein